MGIRKRLKQDRINDSEDCSVCTNAESYGENSDGSEPGILHQHAQAKANVLKQGVDEAHAPGVAAFFFYLIDAAEFA